MELYSVPKRYGLSVEELMELEGNIERLLSHYGMNVHRAKMALKFWDSVPEWLAEELTHKVMEHRRVRGECEHRFKYLMDSYGTDFYECMKCGEIEEKYFEEEFRG